MIALPAHIQKVADDIDWPGTVDDWLGDDGIGLVNALVEVYPHQLPQGEADLFLRWLVEQIVIAGGIPVSAKQVYGDPYSLQPQFGTTPEEIASNVVADWIAAGRPTDIWRGWWFLRRDDIMFPADEDT